VGWGSGARPEPEGPDGLSEGESPLGFVAGPDGERRPLRVALVDDEAVVLRATQALLARLGFQVTAFPVPEAALRHLSDAESRVDLLLTDYIMPGMTGLELAREARKVRPDLPVILSSGNLDEPVEERLAEAGISAVLPKPWEARELMATVRSVLG
jgi:two-component system, cell cycle sensor histidine kinase and response regulator CckA